MTDLLKIMKALSDPSRIKIVAMLGVKEMCVCEIQHALALAQPTVSRHLRILEEAGLVARRKRGLWVDYRLAGDGASAASEKTLALVADIAAQDPELKALMSAVPGIRRENLQAAHIQDDDACCPGEPDAQTPVVHGA